MFHINLIFFLYRGEKLIWKLWIIYNSIKKKIYKHRLYCIIYVSSSQFIETLIIKMFNNSSHQRFYINEPILSMLKIHGTSTVWSCRLYRCNWTPSRDFDPVHKRKLSLSSDRRSALLSHLQPPANRLLIRAAPRVPAAASSSIQEVFILKKRKNRFLSFFFQRLSFRKKISIRENL